MRRRFRWIGPAALVLVAIVLAELPQVRAASQLLDHHRGPLLAAAMGVTAIGFAVFMGGILSMLMTSGTPMTHDEIEGAISQRQWIGQSATWRFAAHRVFGAAAGRQGSYEASFAGVKDAWRTGEWRRDAQWRRFFLTSIGALMLFYGLFSVVLIVAPTHIKALAAAVVVYATAMTARGFAHA